MQVGKNTVVRFHYVMKDFAGEVLEDNTGSEGTSYLHGGSSILAELQLQFEGMHPGENKTILFSGTPGSGTDHYLFEVMIAHVRAATLEEVMLGYVLEVKDPCPQNCDCYEPVTNQQPTT